MIRASQSIVTNVLLVLVLATGIAIVAMLASGVRGGPIDPPGPPASTMQNVIYQPSSCAGFPIVISTLGSYKLGSDITGCSGKDGIQLAATGVTLDLDGHYMYGGAGTLNGIITLTRYDHLTIENGHLSGWGGSGIDLTPSATSQVTNIESGFNSGSGIILGANSTITGVITQSNAANGIVTKGGGDRITDCQSSWNTGTGIYLQADGSTVEDCEVGNNASVGIRGDTSSKHQIARNHVHDNSATGIGMSTDTTIEDNSVDGSSIGIYCGGRCRIAGNVARGGSYGIEVGGNANVIVENQTTSQIGIGVASVSVGQSPNIISGNFSGGNTVQAYSIGAGNDAGGTYQAATNSHFGNVGD